MKIARHTRPNSRYRNPSEAFTDLRTCSSKDEHIKNWTCEDVHGVLVVVTLVSKKTNSRWKLRSWIMTGLGR